MKRPLIGILALLCVTVQAEGPFFVFDSGLNDIKSVEEQATLLKELGYDGICTRPKNASEELYAAFDRHGLEISATYITLPVRNETVEIPQDVTDHINGLKGRKTIIWLGIPDREKTATDEMVVPVLQHVADLAATNGLKVVLYPHVGCYTDTVKSCLRLFQKADRDNLGLSFTLCHFLAQNDPALLEETIRLAAPHLMLVQVNGANQPQGIPKNPGNWNELIKPLGEGDFDVGRVFRILEEVGYDGPVNLQCYKINQPATLHLKTSMNAWIKYNEQP
jgi:sugar phosphate isomerase/epimerase